MTKLDCVPLATKYPSREHLRLPLFVVVVEDEGELGSPSVCLKLLLMLLLEVVLLDVMGRSSLVNDDNGSTPGM